ncbi:MAG: hypothetical protein ACOCWV_01890 [Planctomycetota bacterium]
MKRLCTLIVIGATFLGGYHLGRLPDSPDLIGWGQRTIDRTAEVCRKVVDQLEDWNGEGSQPTTPVGQADDQQTGPLAPTTR